MFYDISRAIGRIRPKNRDAGAGVVCALADEDTANKKDELSQDEVRGRDFRGYLSSGSAPFQPARHCVMSFSTSSPLAGTFAILVFSCGS